MTLDEAIYHAREVAEIKDCPIGKGVVQNE